MEELKIKTRVRDLIAYANPILSSFPKSEKYVLAQNVRQCMQQMLRYCVEIEKKYYKKTTVDNLDLELEVLRNYIRLAADKNSFHGKNPCISLRQYEHLAKRLDEIGRMIGGYKKTLKQ